jgi:hypothetical protein
MPSVCGLMMQHSQYLASTNSTTYNEWALENSHPTKKAVHSDKGWTLVSLG